MAYYLDLFSPATYQAYGRSDRTISGFATNHLGRAQRIEPGDKLLCWVTKLSRWVGVLEVQEGPFTDNTPIFYPEQDPFVVRFRVKPVVWLDAEYAVPIHESRVWNSISWTKGHPDTYTAWNGRVRGSLSRIEPEDGEVLERILTEQRDSPVAYPLDASDQRKLSPLVVRRADKEVQVTVPEKTAEPEAEVPIPVIPELRESHRIQALLARIGSDMGMDVWIPKGDRDAVLSEWKGDHPPILDKLPLNYNEATIRTIEQIDVLWLKRRTIKRAFEVEHTTAIYSGLLRMADLLALQPNMDIRLHIVAPIARREKVFQEIRRPVFSLLEDKALADVCTYLSYDSIYELGEQPHLQYLKEDVLDEYEETAEA